jgi:XTP/dITP diphosphohydrolase
VNRLLVATTNPGKLREIRRVLDGVPVMLLSLSDVSAVAEPEETGRTFAENALLKARYYAAASGVPTVAEDSGLVIDALGGRPGVQSARYPGATYADKFRGLYRELAAHPRPWTARFVCSLAFAGQAKGQWPMAQEDQLQVRDPRPKAQGDLLPRRESDAQDKRGFPWATGPGPRALQVLFRCEATVEGEIADGPHGTFGFGYDPIFYYPPYSSTLGEVTDERKLAVAHRGKAFRQFREWLLRDGLASPLFT